jgi:predicted AAA+ superfamily ATPase
VEKDIVLAAGVQKRREFLTFVRLLAGRVGELLDLSSVGRDAGVDSKTVKDWVSILERMHVIALVPPYASNLSSRLIKSPKIYFIDTGLACRLQGWTSAAPILSSPQQGHLFENLVFSEIFKLNLNYQLGWQLFHWRSRAGEEIDFLVDRGSAHTPLLIEVKVSRPSSPIDVKAYPELRKVFGKQLPPLVCCHQEGERVLGQNVPLARLKGVLLDF